MDQVDNNETLSEAMVVWIGVGYGSIPRRSDDRLVEVYGEDRAARLRPLLYQLMVDFFRSDAKNNASGTGDMSRKVEAEFRPKHPEISEEAVSALAWMYVWEFK